MKSLGINVLELSLIRSCESLRDASSSKKRRLEIGATDPQHSSDLNSWLELARLYKSLGDSDALRGIFSSRIATSALTLQALDCEATSDHDTAAKLYTQVPCDVIERMFCFEECELVYDAGH